MLLFQETSLGRIGIREQDGCISDLYLPGAAAPAGEPPSPTPLLRQAFAELGEYLDGRRCDFTLPLRPAGSAFMKQVWAQLCRIPCGRTAAYGEVAAALGRPGAARAVGLACNRNPIPILIPCHRVVGASGGLTGYGGGLTLKRRLLELEARQTGMPADASYTR